MNGQSSAACATRTAAVANRPSLVAVSVMGPPGAMPRTAPLDDTVAIATSGLVQVTVRPMSRRPSAARDTALSPRVVPTNTVTTLGVTLTVATAGPLTVTGTVALMVESSTIFTTTFAVPFVTPVTLPNASTVATAGADDDQLTVRVFGLRSVAVSFADCPSSSVNVAGVTNTAGGNGFVESQATAMNPVAAASTAHRPLATPPSSGRSRFACGEKYTSDPSGATGK